MDFLSTTYFGTTVLELLIFLTVGFLLYFLLKPYCGESGAFSSILVFIVVILLTQYLTGVSLLTMLVNAIDYAPFRYKVIPLFVFFFTFGFFYEHRNFRKTLTMSFISMLGFLFIQLLL